MIAIGSPFGFENSVSAGVVSGVHRALPGGQMTPFIQTDVAVNPGQFGRTAAQRGGPGRRRQLADLQPLGRLHGPVVRDSGGRRGQGRDQIKTHGKVTHGRLGVGIQQLNQSLAQSFGLPDTNGALSARSRRAARPRRPGFKSGDVIRKIDGVAMNDSTDVTSRIGNTAPGTKIALEVWRDGKPVDVDGDRRHASTTPRRPKADDATEGKGKLGVAVRPLTPDEKKDGGTTGWSCRTPTGPAAQAGIQAGDVIVGVGTARCRRSTT